MKKQTCLWCHSAGTEELEPIDCGEERALVHPSHRPELEQYCRETEAAKWRFLGGIGASILLGVIGQLLLMLPSKMPGAVVLGIAATVAAVTILRYPFATPETVAMVGVRRSIRIARSCGYLILAIGVGLAAYGITL